MHTKDLIIIGGGPAGVAAGVYAARKCLSTTLITVDIGGQSVDSLDVQNWVGTVSISGRDLAKALRDHLDAYKDGFVEVVEGSPVEHLTKNADGSFTVTTKAGTSYMSRAVLIASGARRRRLAVPGADTFEHKGVTYCASCDGPMFGGMDVAVIGGGNAGFETAAQLLAYAKSVTLLHKHDSFKADPITVEKVLSHSRMTGITNAEPVEVTGEQFVSGLRYRKRDTGEETLLPVSGVFVEIGVLPATDFAKDLVERDGVGRIVVSPKDQKTSCPGIWAAGDCTNELYHQNNIAAGDGVKALEDIYIHLKAK